MKATLSNIVSIILIPLLMPVYLFIIAIIFFPNMVNIVSWNEKIIVLGSVISATILLPFISIFILYKLKYVSSLFLEKRNERKIPQIISVLLYTIFTIILTIIYGFQNLLSLIMFANTVSLAIITFITFYYKISTHTTGAMGFITILSILLLKQHSPTLTILYLLALGFTISVFFARVYLKAHTINQVLLGGGLGLLSGLVLVFFI